MPPVHYTSTHASRVMHKLLNQTRISQNTHIEGWLDSVCTYVLLPDISVCGSGRLGPAATYIHVYVHLK